MNQSKKILLALMSLFIAFTSASCSNTADTEENEKISNAEEALACSIDAYSFLDDYEKAHDIVIRHFGKMKKITISTDFSSSPMVSIRYAATILLISC